MKQSCAGMISYKWIEECCRTGELVDTESHKIRRLGNRNTGGHRTARRNEFSAADDRLLVEFVKKHAAVNGAISGNKIYDSLAAVVSPASHYHALIVSIVNTLLSRGGIGGLRSFLNGRM
jgi:hypothetical protein